MPNLLGSRISTSIVGALALVAVLISLLASSAQASSTLSVPSLPDAPDLATASFEDASAAYGVMAPGTEITIAFADGGSVTGFASVEVDEAASALIFREDSGIILVAMWGGNATAQLVITRSIGGQDLTSLGFPAAFAGANLPQAHLLTAANGGALSVPTSSIPASISAELGSYYPGAGSGQLVLQAGINVAGSISTDVLPDVITTALSGSTDLVLTANLGSNGSSVMLGDPSGFTPNGVTLSASVPALTQNLPSWLALEPPTLGLAVDGEGGIAPSLTVVGTATIDGNVISLSGTTSFSFADKSATLQVGTAAPWVNALGITGFTVAALNANISAGGGGEVQADLAGTFNAGSSSIDLGFAYDAAEWSATAAIDTLQFSELATVVSGTSFQPADIPVSLSNLILEIDPGVGLSIAGNATVFGVTGGFLFSLQEREGSPSILVGASLASVRLGDVTAFPAPVSDITLPEIVLVYNQGAAIDLAPGDLTAGELQFFDGYFGLDEAAGTNLVLAGGSAGFNAESMLPYSALPAEFVAATGLDAAGAVTLAGNVAFAPSGLQTFELHAELSGLPTIGMPEALFDGDPSTPTRLFITADLTSAEGAFAFGLETGLLLVDGADSVPVLLQAGFEDGAVSFSAETTAAWVTPFGQAWMGTLDTVSFAIEAGTGGELSVTMQAELVLGMGGVLALEFTAETDGSTGSFEFAATADGITDEHIVALLTNAGVDPSGLDLPDFVMQNLILSATADTDLNLALDIGGSISLFDTNVNLLLSLQIDESGPTVIVGVGANGLRLDAIVPGLAADEIVGGFEFSSLALIVSVGGETVVRDDLTPAARNFFDSIYGEDDYEVELGTGVQFVANMLPFNGLAESMSQLGMDAPTGALRITGSLGVPWGDQTAFSVALRAELSGYTAPDHSEEWLRAANLAVEVSATFGSGTPSIQLALVGDMTVKIIDGTLDEAGNLADAEVTFFVAAQFKATATGVSLQFSGGISGDPWTDPFGLEWLTINHLVLGIGLETSPPSLDVYFDADVVIAGKQMAGTIGLAINVNTGIPTNLVVELSSTSTWGTDDLVTLYTLLDPIGGEWLGGTIPVIQLRPYDQDTPLRFKFVLRDSPTASAGFALSGSLWVAITKGGALEQVANLDIDVSTAGIYLEGAVSRPIYLGVATLESADFDLDWTFVPPEFALLFAAEIRSELFGFTTQVQGEIPFDVEAALGEVLLALRDTEAIWALLKPLLEDDPLAALKGDLIDDLYAAQGLETPVWISELLLFIEALPAIQGIPVTPVQLVNDVLGGFDISVPPGAGYPAGGETADGCGLLNPLKHTDERCYTITPSPGNEAGFRSIIECPIFQFLEDGRCWIVPPSVTDSVPMQTVCPVGSTLEGGRCWVLGRTPNNLAYAEQNKVYSCDFLWVLEGSKCSWYNVFGVRTGHVDAYYGCPVFTASFEGKCYTSPIPGTPSVARNVITGAEIPPTLGCADIFQVKDFERGLCWSALGPPTLASNPNPTVRQECSYINFLGIPEPGTVVNGKCYYLGQVPRVGTPVGGADQGCAFWAPFFVNGKCWTIPPTPEVQIVKLPGLCTQFDISCTLTGLIEDTILSPIVEDLKQDLKLHQPDIANRPPTAVLGFYTVPEGGSLTIEVAASDPEGGALTYAWDLNADGSYDDATTRTVVFSAAGRTGPSLANIAVRVTDEAGEFVIARGEVTIASVAPTLVVTGDASVEAAATYTLHLSASDPGGTQTLRWRVDWGDNSAESTLMSASGTLTHVYTGSVLNPTITVTASDKDGDYDAAPVAVTVIQVDPEVTLTAPGMSDEGSLVVIEGTLFEPGGDDPLTLLVDWGDGTTVTSVAAAGVESYTTSHRYADDGTYTITVRATNPYGAFDEASATIVVANVAPSLELGTVEGDEGSSVTLQGAISDPGTLDSFEIVVEWGDGETSNLERGAGATSLEASHVYADDGLYTVTVTVTDKDGGSVSRSTTADIANVAPTLADASLTPAPSDEGAEVTFTAVLVEPGADVVTVVIDWGDGSSSTESYQPGETEVVFTHTYLDNSPEDDGQYRVTVTATDDDGGSTELSEDHGVRNVAPATIELDLTSAVINEGDEVTLSGAFFDPGVLDTFTVVIDWGDGSEPTELSLAAGVQEFEAAHVYVDDDPTGTAGATYTITVIVTDKDGGVGEAAIDIDVLNVAPELVVTPTEETILSTEDLDITATFTDVGTLDTHTAVIDWGDGTSEVVAVDQAAGGGSFSGSHRYVDPGQYTVTVTLTDDDGGVDEVTVELEVLGPRDLIERAIDLMAPFNSPQVSNADRSMRQSLEGSLWSDVIRGDSNRGHSIFDRVRQGANDLNSATTSGPPAQRLSGSAAGTASEASELLATAAWIIVRVQLVDTEHYPAGVPANRLNQVNREYGNAQSAFADGEAALAAGEYERAIQYFRSAWQSLERAQAHAGR